MRTLHAARCTQCLRPVPPCLHSLLRVAFVLSSQVLGIISNISNRQHFDEMCEGGEVFRNLTSEARLIHIRFRARGGGLCQKLRRDFCLLLFCAELADGTCVVMSRSVEHRACPPQSGYTRADLLISGWLLRPSSDGSQTEATCASALQMCVAARSHVAGVCCSYVVHTDLRGSVPSWMSNVIGAKQPLLIAKLRDFVE